MTEAAKLADDLLPCPFCGEARIFLNRPSQHYRYGSINCPACLVVMPGEVRDQNELIDCWNARSGPRDVREALERIEKLINGGRPNAAISAIRAMISSLPASGTAGEEWQPIETAPKDGTHILATWIDSWPNHPHVEAVYFAETAWFYSYDGDGHSRPPSHWRPLIAPVALAQAPGAAHTRQGGEV
jgi:hypothetical protein